MSIRFALIGILSLSILSFAHASIAQKKNRAWQSTFIQTMQILSTPSAAQKLECRNPEPIPFVSSPCKEFSKTPSQIDMTGLVSSLDQFKTQGHFPAIPTGEGTDPNLLDPSTPLPKPILESFNQLGKAVFGRNGELQLVPCREDCEGMLLQTDIESKKIYVSLTYLNELSGHLDANDTKRIFNFILAHELNHYVYERLVDLSPTKRSPSGLGSIIRSEYPDNWDFETNDASRNALEQYFEHNARGHAEVDALAIATLRQIDPTFTFSDEAINALFPLMERDNIEIDGIDSFFTCLSEQEILLRRAVVRHSLGLHQAD